jgi:hypothetical protein
LKCPTNRAGLFKGKRKQLKPQKDIKSFNLIL